MSEYKFYLVEKKPPLAWVYLNRPEKKNAMNPPAWLESPAVFAGLDNDPEIRVIVLAAKGPGFSAGIDLIEMGSYITEIADPNQKGGTKWKFLPKIYELQETMTCIERCRKPVIAAVHGVCIGAGLDMITACDIRLCSEDAVFSLREAAVGFVADVGQATLMKEAEAMALEIAGNSPLAVQASKVVLNYGIGKTVDDALKYVATISANIVPSDDLFEAFTAFAEKRKPKFTGK